MDGPRTMRVVAVSAAVVAMVFTLVAVIVVLTRDGEQAKASARPESAVRDHVVRAADVVKLRENVEIVIDAGNAKGLRVKDAELARTLGLEPGDIITALSGKPMLDDRDTYEMIQKLGLSGVTALYVDVMRGSTPLLVRWKLDGDLREARYSSIGLGSGATRPPRAPDPILDAIEKIDDTHYKVPRSTVDALLADPMKIANGARVVPSLRNGQPNGFKLYAIRPVSLYARVGFQNGDTVHAINGYELTSADKALEVYTKLRDAEELRFELSRRGRPLSLIIQITK